MRAADLPLFDLEGDPGSPELRRGLFETGFFLLRDHVIPRPLLDEVRTRSLRFLGEAEDRKQGMLPDGQDLRGWSPLRAESSAAGYGGSEGDPKGDDCEKFSMGPVVSAETRASDPAYYAKGPGDWYYAENRFPDAAFRAAWEAYYLRMEALCARLLETVRATLDVPSGTWNAVNSRPGSVMRFLHYPDHEGGIRMAAHYDDTLITVLHQSVPANGFAALEVQLPGQDDWQAVVPSDDVFVVNIGEALTYLSGGQVVATKHRVVGAPAGQAAGSERSSLAYFYIPNYNARLQPLDVAGVDPQLTAFHDPDLQEPDGSVIYHKVQQRDVAKLQGKTEA